MKYATEDWYGLYELLFDIQGSPSELRDANNRRAVIEPVLRRLLGLGLIELGVRPYSTGIPVMAAEPEGSALLADDRSWIVPAGKESVVVYTATSLGDEVFSKGARSS